MEKRRLNRIGVATVIGMTLAMAALFVTTGQAPWGVENVAGAPTAGAAPAGTTTTTATTTTMPTTTPTTTPAAPTTTAPTSPPSAAAAPAPANCATPAFETSGPDDGWSDGGYYVHNNMWNAADYSVSQQLAACSAGNWSVTTTADDNRNDGAVKTYPNVHKDYHDWESGEEPPLRQYPRLTSTFAATGPDSGIYNFAYDIWLNGVPGDREVMIWTANHRQSPAGDRVASGLPFSGTTWDLYATADNEYLAFLPSRALAGGTLDLRAFLDYLVENGRVPADSTLGQICFGVEVVSTDGRPATFQVTDFSVTD